MKKYRINYKIVARNILVLFTIILFLNITIDFLQYPEMYLTTWKYQLKKEVEAGEPEAITYYNRHYLSKGVFLFDNE